MVVHSVRNAPSLTARRAFVQQEFRARASVLARGGLAIAFRLVVVARREQPGLPVEAQGAAAQADVALRGGNLDALLLEEAADVVVDRAPDGGVAARAVGPDEQAEL